MEGLKAFISWLLWATRGYAVKIVNPGGVENWKWGRNVGGLDDLVYAAAGGDVTGCHRAFDRLLAAGVAPIQIQRALMNHLVRLRGVVSKAETTGLEPALAGLRPPIFFKRKSAFDAQARRWTRQRLSLAIDRMIQAEIELKRTGAEETLALWRACFDVARAAAARPRVGSNSR